MKKIIMIPLMIITMITGIVGCKSSKASSNSTVFISQVVEHPAINATVKGITDVLREQKVAFQIESAQGNPALAGQIASKFMAQNPKIVVGIGTMSAQSFVKYALKNETKVVFSSVTDPIGNLPNNSNICGVSNFVSLEPQLELFKKMQPNLKRLGILYNPGEGNSVSIVKKLKTIVPKFGLILVEQVINKTGDVAQSVVQLSSQCDAIFISNDNTALGAMQTIIKLSKVPVYVSDTDAVALGAVAAVGPNQYKIGMQTGQMILRLLKGEPCEFVEYPSKTELFVNKEIARKWGLILCEESSSRAQRGDPTDLKKQQWIAIVANAPSQTRVQS